MTIKQTDGRVFTNAVAEFLLMKNLDKLLMRVFKVPLAVGLAHELGHAENLRDDSNAANLRDIQEDSQYETKEERKVIEEVKKPIIEELNKNGNNYEGTKVPVECSTCTY